MRRGLVIGALMACVVVGIVVIRSGSSPGYRFNAVFDTAQGMVAGQDVKIAGAKVGTVLSVHLTSDLKARMELQINSRFAPFHSDASCRILPEGLISENYVECDPGTSTGPLATGASGLATVPVARTTEPVTLQQLLNIFTYPTGDRLALMMNELGVATAGEGENINAILRRANPALAQARQVLSIIDAQRAQVAGAVGQTDQVLAQLAARDRDVRSFVDNAAAVARTTAAHRTTLGEGVQRLPALLASVRSSFASLNAFAKDAPPLLADLRASGPGLTSLTSRLPRFISAATPAINGLGSAAAQGTVAAHSAAPVIADLSTFASHAGPTAKLLDPLLVSMRDRGAIEGLLNFVYSLSVAGGTYDSLSHIASIDAVVPPCIANQTSSGCDANFHRPAAAAAAAARKAAAPSARHRVWVATGSRSPASRSPVGQTPAPTAAPTAAPSVIPPVANPTSTASSLQGLLNYLLK